jgi:membrane-associated protein
MDALLQFLGSLTDSKQILEYVITYGLWVVVLIVFAENGLFFAFFLPGDYLLFLTGLFGGTGKLQQPLGSLLFWIWLGAVLGSLVGYLTGRYFGDTLQNQKENWFFKKKRIDQTRDFFEKHGSKALIICRFLPLVRTFTPILAGIIRMPYRMFLPLNIIGAAVWVGAMVGGGYFLGEHFPQLANYIEYIVVFFLLVTTFTVIRGYFGLKKDTPRAS